MGHMLFLVRMVADALQLEAIANYTEAFLFGLRVKLILLMKIV